MVRLELSYMRMKLNFYDPTRMSQHATKRYNGHRDFHRGRCRPSEGTTERSGHDNCDDDDSTIIRHQKSTSGGLLDDDANGDDRRDRVHHDVSDDSISDRNDHLSRRGIYNDDSDVFTYVGRANNFRETRGDHDDVHRDAIPSTNHQRTVSAVQHVNVLLFGGYSGTLENTRV